MGRTDIDRRAFRPPHKRSVGGHPSGVEIAAQHPIRFIFNPSDNQASAAVAGHCGWISDVKSPSPAGAAAEQCPAFYPCRCAIRCYLLGANFGRDTFAVAVVRPGQQAALNSILGTAGSNGHFVHIVASVDHRDPCRRKECVALGAHSLHADYSLGRHTRPRHVAPAGAISSQLQRMCGHVARHDDFTAVTP